MKAFLDKGIELAQNTGIFGDVQSNISPFTNSLDAHAKDALLARARPDIAPKISVEQVIESVTTKLIVVATSTKLKILTHPSCHQMWICQLLLSFHVTRSISFKANKALMWRALSDVS